MSDPQRVQRMFDGIARRYDAFNTVASLGRDESWRRLTARIAAPEPVERGLDAAAGTGKLSAILAARARQVTASDFSAPMLVRGGPDLAARASRSASTASRATSWPCPSPTQPSTAPPSASACATSPTSPSACASSAERSSPADGWRCWTSCAPAAPSAERRTASASADVMPLVGWALSGDRSAYQYLPESVERYLAPDELASAMTAAGFTNVGYRNLMLGAIAIHWGVAG